MRFSGKLHLEDYLGSMATSSFVDPLAESDVEAIGFSAQQDLLHQVQRINLAPACLDGRGLGGLKIAEIGHHYIIECDECAIFMSHAPIRLQMLTPIHCMGGSYHTWSFRQELS